MHRKGAVQDHEGRNSGIETERLQGKIIQPEKGGQGDGSQAASSQERA